jgi:hypothetical protein
MATRSTIARVTPTGTIESIYCHWDGYVEFTGKTLYNHYTTDAQVAELIELGDLSSVGETIEDGPDACVAYGRDRGERGTQPIINESIEEWLAFRGRSNCEYAYLWDGTNWVTYARGWDWDKPVWHTV